MPSASTVYISTPTNKHNHAGHVSPSSAVIAVAANKFVALWDPASTNGRAVQCTLAGHTADITCVHFVSDVILVTGDDKGELLVWMNVNESWSLLHRFASHQHAISALQSFTTAGRSFVVSGSSDAILIVWSLEVGVAPSTLKQIQTLPLNGRFALSIEISTLPESSALVMAVGTTDRSVSLFTLSESLSEFSFATHLPGHDDWVRALSFRPTTPSTNGPLLLASGAQDNTIRLWQILPTQVVQKENATDELLDAFEAALEDVDNTTRDSGEASGRTISLKQHILAVKLKDTSLKRYHVTFDALLLGHEAAVTSVAWCPVREHSLPPTLLSTSADSSVIIWRADIDTNLWVPVQRFGDIGGQKLGGFVGGLWVNAGHTFLHDALAWGWTGGWRRWRNHEADRWMELSAITGHQAAVRGLCWSPDGTYLLSTSYDQSTRIHALVEETGCWHEIARPQVHGYDLIAATFIGSNPLRFVSVSDERVARVFNAPRVFTALLENICPSFGVKAQVDQPIAASVAPLGLSNKADASNDQAAVLDETMLRRIPFEGELASRTLWPESDKVFGHGYELIAVASSHDGQLIATSCKATSPEHAVVRIFDARPGSGWVSCGVLSGHALTVTRIRWSHDDQFILTVSRDRTWRVFGPRTTQNEYPPAASAKVHSRIVWDCAWAPDDSSFITVARDKTARVWRPGGEEIPSWVEASCLPLPDPGTAVDVMTTQTGRWLVAIGMENGHVVILEQNPSSLTLTQIMLLDSKIAAIDQIYQVAWRPEQHALANPAQRSGDAAELAICSEDGTLRILLIQLN